MTGHGRTEQVIARAMKTLMETTPLEELSVGEIIAASGVSRNTFYYHFKDKYDLVNKIFYAETECFARTPVKRSNWQQTLYSICRYLRENSSFYRNALRVSGQNSLQEYLTQYFVELLQCRLAELADVRGGEFCEKDARFAARFYAYAVVGLIVKWAQSGMREDFSTYEESLRKVLTGTLLEEYLDEQEDES